MPSSQYWKNKYCTLINCDGGHYSPNGHGKFFFVDLELVLNTRIVVMEHYNPFRTFQPENREYPFREFSCGTNERIVFHLVPDRNFQKFCLNGKRPEFHWQWVRNPVPLKSVIQSVGSRIQVCPRLPYLVFAQIDTNIDSHQWLLSTLTCEESYNKADLFARLKMFGVFDFGFSMWEALIVQKNFRRHPKNLKIYLVK